MHNRARAIQPPGRASSIIPRLTRGDWFVAFRTRGWGGRLRSGFPSLLAGSASHGRDGARRWRRASCALADVTEGWASPIRGRGAVAVVSEARIRPRAGRSLWRSGNHSRYQGSPLPLSRWTPGGSFARLRLRDSASRSRCCRSVCRRRSIRGRRAASREASGNCTSSGAWRECTALGPPSLVARCAARALGYPKATRRHRRADPLSDRSVRHPGSRR